MCYEATDKNSYAIDYPVYPISSARVEPQVLSNLDNTAICDGK